MSTVRVSQEYEWKTFSRTTVSIPPLLGQPYQIQPYGPPQADENLQMVTTMMIDRTTFL